MTIKRVSLVLAAGMAAGRLRQLRRRPRPRRDGAIRRARRRHPPVRGQRPGLRRDPADARAPGRLPADRPGGTGPADPQGHHGARRRHPRARLQRPPQCQPRAVARPHGGRAGCQELPDREPGISGRDARHADRHAPHQRRPRSRDAVLRADLVADQPAGQGCDRVRQHRGLCAPAGGRQQHLQAVRQRRRPRSAGLHRHRTRKDPGHDQPGALLGDQRRLATPAGRATDLHARHPGLRLTAGRRRVRVHHAQPGEPDHHRRAAAPDPGDRGGGPEPPRGGARVAVVPGPRRQGVHARQPAAAAPERPGARERPGRRARLLPCPTGPSSPAVCSRRPS